MSPRLLSAPLAIATICGLALALGAQAQTRDLTVVEKPSVQPARPQRTPFAVSLVPIGSPVLRIGVPIRFKVVSTQSGYGNFYVASASGKVQLWAENIRLRAGQPVELPNRGFSIVASPPAGDETIVFLVTRSRFAGFFDGFTVTKPTDVQVSREGLSATLQSKLSGLPRSAWASTQTSIRVTD